MPKLPKKERTRPTDLGQFSCSSNRSPCLIIRGTGRNSLRVRVTATGPAPGPPPPCRSEEHTSELQSHVNLVCRLLLEKKKQNKTTFKHISEHRLLSPPLHNLSRPFIMPVPPALTYADF